MGPAKGRLVFLAVAAVFLLIGAATFMGGLPAFAPEDDAGGIAYAMASATAAPAATTALPASTPGSVRSEQVILDVAANVDGFELELVGGIRADDVVKIDIAVSDNYGRHVVSWQYPFIGERFYLPVEMYGGSLYGTRYLRCEAVFANGGSEAVFAQNYL